jgi:hypothetical protein
MSAIRLFRLIWIALANFITGRDILVACCQEYSIGTQIGSFRSYFNSQNFDFHLGTDIEK